MRAISMLLQGSLFTSCTCMPEPLAMRALRDALIRSGLAPFLRRHREMMASERFTIFSSTLARRSVAAFADAGQHAHDAGEAAHLLHLLQLGRHVAQVELALLHL